MNTTELVTEAGHVEQSLRKLLDNMYARMYYLEQALVFRDTFSVKLDSDDKTFRCVYCGVILDSETLEVHPGEEHGCICPKKVWPIDGKHKEG